MQTLRADVVVVGLGGFGSAALWRLAARGVRAIGIERQGIGHHLGSSHGRTRLFRVACREHPELARIALSSLRLWNELGDRAGLELVRQTGCLTTAPRDSPTLDGVRAAAAAAGVPVQRLDHRELVERQPQYAGLSADDEAVWDPGAGLCYPERIVRAQTEAAGRLGATVYPHTMVTAIVLEPDGVRLRTPTVEFAAEQVVVAAGAWLGTLVPGLSLRPRRTPLFWFEPRDPDGDEFRLDRFPAFVWQRAGAGALWGHGADEDFGVKVGMEGAAYADATVEDPEELDRYIHPGADIERLAARVADRLPGLRPQPSKVIPCVITDSPDGQFLVGRPDDDRRLLIAGGDSGHGFKHAAGVGELLAQLVVGETPYCATDFVDPNRFRQ